MENINKKRDAHIIGEDYGMFPDENVKFEMEYSQTAASWAFFADRSNRTVCHIKFNSDELVSPH